jgi:hypothetical protein
MHDQQPSSSHANKEVVLPDLDTSLFPAGADDLPERTATMSIPATSAEPEKSDLPSTEEAPILHPQDQTVSSCESPLVQPQVTSPGLFSLMKEKFLDAVHLPVSIAGTAIFIGGAMVAGAAEPRLVRGMREKGWLPAAKEFFEDFSKHPECEYQDFISHLAVGMPFKSWNGVASLQDGNTAWRVSLQQEIRINWLKVKASAVAEPRIFIAECLPIFPGGVLAVKCQGIQSHLSQVEWKLLRKHFTEGKVPDTKTISDALQAIRSNTDLSA